VTPIVDWGLAQEGVLAGYAHAWAWPATGYPVPGNDECCIPFEFPVQVARGTASFLCEEIMDELGSGPLSRGGFVLWRTLQNMGYRIALTDDSDIDCLGDQVGVPRTLALVATGPGEEGASGLTYARFLDAIRQGRTVLAAGKGTQLDLLVNGARLGDEVALEAPGEVTVEVRSQLAQAASVDLLVNGVPAAQARLEAGAQTATATLQLSRSAWISARTARAQTSAIYVLVAGAPIRASAEDACYMVKYMDHLRGLVLQGAFPLGDEQAATLLGYDEARTEFLRRFQESGGTTCP